MKNSLELSPPQDWRPQAPGHELRESLAELKRQLRLCPALTDEMLGELFGAAPALVQRLRGHVGLVRAVIHERTLT